MKLWGLKGWMLGAACVQGVLSAFSASSPSWVRVAELQLAPGREIAASCVSALERAGLVSWASSLATAFSWATSPYEPPRTDEGLVVSCYVDLTALAKTNDWRSTLELSLLYPVAEAPAAFEKRHACILETNGVYRTQLGDYAKYSDDARWLFLMSNPQLSSAMAENLALVRQPLNGRLAVLTVNENGLALLCQNSARLLKAAQEDKDFAALASFLQVYLDELAQIDKFSCGVAADASGLLFYCDEHELAQPLSTPTTLPPLSAEAFAFAARDGIYASASVSLGEQVYDATAVSRWLALWSRSGLHLEPAVSQVGSNETTVVTLQLMRGLEAFSTWLNYQAGAFQSELFFQDLSRLAHGTSKLERGTVQGFCLRIAGAERPASAQTVAERFKAALPECELVKPYSLYFFAPTDAVGSLVEVLKVFAPEAMGEVSLLLSTLADTARTREGTGALAAMSWREGAWRRMFARLTSEAVRDNGLLLIAINQVVAKVLGRLQLESCGDELE